MKTIRFISVLLLSVVGCNSPYEAPRALTFPSDKNNQSLDSLTRHIELLNIGGSSFKALATEINNYGSKVGVYNELLDLFNPDKFACGLSENVKQRLKESRRNNEANPGFIPDIVVNNTSKYEKAIKLDGRGANILVHYFTYELADKSESKPIISIDAPTQQSFNTVNWVDNKPENYDSFFFTMDCAGYFSASAKVASRGGFLGIGRIEVDAEGSNTINQSQSILVMRVMIYSPLYAAYSGESLYRISNQMDAQQKKAILSNRVLTLQSILMAIPTIDQVDSRRVYLNSNYESIITSNQGNSGYNGTGKLNSTIQINFVAAQVGGALSASNSINRKSEYKSYNTYILEANKDAIINKLTVKDIKDKIIEINAAIASL